MAVNAERAQRIPHVQGGVFAHLRDIARTEAMEHRMVEALFTM